MPRSQLAINCPAPLLERLRAEAQRQQVTATSLVLTWIQAGLDGQLEAPREASRTHLERRLDALEQRLDALEQPPKQPSRPPKQPSPPPKQKPLEQPAEAITTAALADLLGMRRHTLNARLARAGGAAIGLEMEGWRIVAKVKPSRGGPEQWGWLPAAAAG